VYTATLYTATLYTEFASGRTFEALSHVRLDLKQPMAQLIQLWFNLFNLPLGLPFRLPLRLPFLPFLSVLVLVRGNLRRSQLLGLSSEKESSKVRPSIDWPTKTASLQLFKLKKPFMGKAWYWGAQGK
jgi:hypothetical protein